MAINPLKVFLFVVGGTAAATAAALVSGALTPDPQPIASGQPETAITEAQPAAPLAEAPPAGQNTVAAAAPATPPAPQSAESGASPAPETVAVPDPAPEKSAEAGESLQAALAPQPDGAPAQPDGSTGEGGAVPLPEPLSAGAPDAAATPPTFDLLRVEPDGSTVVAGQAMPDAAVELKLGEQILGKAEAGPNGDFAIVLDEPLKPGDHQITIEATLPAGQPVDSAQTAIVSVPAEPDGQVLAMVEEPGEPSKLLTVPEAAPGDAIAQDTDEPQAMTPAGENVVAAAPQTETPAVQQAPTVPAASGSQSSPGPSDDPARQDAAAGSTGDGVSPAPDQDTAANPATIAPETAPAPVAPSGMGGDVASAAAEPETGQGAPAEADEQVALNVPEAGADASATSPAADAPSVAVQAVEIDGGKVFVAGTAAPGSTLRVYAGALYLGETRASPDGQFLVEAQIDLPVGEYVVRADMLDASGKVVARAAVPFDREPGETIAAVAPSVQAPSAQQQGEADAGAAAGAPVKSADGGAAVPAAEPQPAAHAGTQTPASAEQANAPSAQPTDAGTAPAESQVAGAEEPAIPAPAESVAAPAGAEGSPATLPAESVAEVGQSGTGTQLEQPAQAADAGENASPPPLVAEAPAVEDDQPAPAAASSGTDIPTEQSVAVAPAPDGSAEVGGDVAAGTAKGDRPASGNAEALTSGGEDAEIAEGSAAGSGDVQAGTVAGTQQSVVGVEDAGAEQPAETAANPASGGQSVASGEPASEGPANSGANEIAAAEVGNPPDAGSSSTGADPEVAVAPVLDEPADATPSAGGSAPGAGASEGASAQPALPMNGGTAETGLADGSSPAATPTPDQQVAAAEEGSAVLAPKLQSVNGNVIIRRGDSLWRISRRVYGRGVRYSTLYLANQDQIRDPNRIWPGQIFTVPGTAMDGAVGDLQALGEQGNLPVPTARN